MSVESITRPRGKKVEEASVAGSRNDLRPIGADGKKRYILFIRSLYVISLIVLVSTFAAYITAVPHDINIIFLGFYGMIVPYLAMSFLAIRWVSRGRQDAPVGAAGQDQMFKIIVITLIGLVASFVVLFLLPFFGLALYLYLVRVVRG
jgi:uncharacterized membrane-anchored protein